MLFRIRKLRVGNIQEIYLVEQFFEFFNDEKLNAI
jgi:hypothetical protein